MFSSGHSSTTQWRLGKPRCLEAEWHVTHFQTACGSKVNMKTFHTSMCGRGSARGRRSRERLHPRTKASNQRPRLCLQSLKSQRSPREAERLRGNQQHVKPKLVLWKYQQNWQTNWPRVLRWHTNFNHEWQKGHCDQSYRNGQDLQGNIGKLYQQIWKLRWNGQIPRRYNHLNWLKKEAEFVKSRKSTCRGKPRPMWLH